MKGSIFALSETFVKILSTALVALVLLAVFFTLNEYRLIYSENKDDREALVTGNTVLSSCLAEISSGVPVKGLLSEEVLFMFKDDKTKNIHCLQYEKAIYIEVYDGNTLLYGFGNSSACARFSSGKCMRKVSTSYSTFPASLNKTSGSIIPVTLEVFVG